MTGIPTFDLEAVNWVNPIAAGFFDGEEYHEFIRKDEQDDVIWRFLCFLREHYKGYKMYAHYASKYDNKFILASLCKHGEEVDFEAGLVRLKWRGPGISFEDSFPLVPMSLARTSELFGKDQKGEWEHKRNLKPWEMGDQLGTFKEYLKNDCLVLSESLYGLCELLGMTFGVTPSITLSTTSAKTFSTLFYPLEKVDPNEEFEEFIRRATYGGRNEVYRRYGEGINHYDIRSMFVSCYDTPVPVGRMRWVHPNIDEGTIVEAEVKVPKDMYVGPLPYRLNDRLVFPVGEFKGWWDIRELRSAIKLGVDAILTRQLACDELPIMKEFGIAVSNLRKGKHGEFWKMFGLALSGKLGQSRWREFIVHSSRVKDFEGFYPMDEAEEYFIGKEYVGAKAPYIKAAVSMRIRSESRVRHLQIVLEALKSGQIFYCDTDSIFTTSEMPTGEKTGELTFLGKASKGYFIKQKLYALVKKGKLEQKSAGYSDLKLSEQDFINLLEGQDLTVEGTYFSSSKALLKEQEVKLLKRSSNITRPGGESRVPDGRDTRPICLP